MVLLIRGSFGLVLATFLLILSPAPSWAQDSFSKGKTVLILVGLPGDAESEDSYTSQVNRLLDCFNQPDSIPQSVIVLSSLSGISKDSKKFQITTRGNTRDDYLQVASELKPAELQNLVFIMLGHGGVLAKSRVFHVPGPRLKPEDLAVLTQKMGTGSACILFFPGSGTFCSGSQPPGVSFLTSDGEDAFTHDPKAAEIFVQVLEKQRGTLSSVAQAFGREVGSWYESRNEVRQEEPTLWTNGKPENLWAESTGSAADKIQPAVQVRSGDDRLGPVQSSTWAQIHPVDAKDFPDDDAVTLLDRTSMLLDDNSMTRTESEQFIQILKPNGKRFGDFQFSFNPPNEELEIQACEVRLPDGSLQLIGEEDIRQAGPQGEAEEAEHAQHKMFSLPHAEPGSILHVRILRTEKRLQWPHIVDSVELGSEIPVVDRKLEIKIPASSAFHFKLFASPALDPVVTLGDYGSTYAWEWKNVAPSVGEPFSPAGCSPELAISTFPDWANFTDWYRRIIQGSDTLTPELALLAKELTKDCKTDQDKVDAITRFVTGFRYIAVPLGVNSIRPHFAAEVCTNRYGDCKDKANLVDTLLRSLGFKTDLVLVPRFGQAYPDLPGFGFNHAIANVEVDGKPEWIDSTDDVCRTGFLPPGDCGRNVLVVNAPGKTLTALPLTEAGANQLELNITMNWPDPAKRDPALQLDLKAMGIFDYLVRSAGSHDPTAQRKKPWLSDLLEPTTGKLILRKQTANDLSDLKTDVTSSAQGEWIGAITRLNESTELIRLPVLLPREWISALVPRTHPLELTYGYPLKLAETVNIQLPGNVGPVTLPTPASESNPVDSWEITWSQTSPTELQAHVQFTLAQADMLAPNQPAEFQTSLSKFMDALQDGVEILQK